jgi:hypothetical protein
VTTALTSVQLTQGVTVLQQGLPPAYAMRVGTTGEPASMLGPALAGAVSQTPGPVAFAQALAVSPPTPAFRAAAHTITAAELSAVVSQLASQHALSRRARNLLQNDLRTLTRAANATAHTRALAKLRRDAAGAGRSTRAATETLLVHAAAGLS